MNRARHLFGAEGAHEIVEFLASGQDTQHIARSAEPARQGQTLVLTRNRPATPRGQVLDRHVLRYVPEQATTVRPATAFTPARTLIVVDHTVDTSTVTQPDSTVLTVTDQSWSLAGQPVGEEQQALRDAIAEHAPQHIRVVTDLGAATDDLTQAVRQTEAESTARRGLPAVVYAGDRRTVARATGATIPDALEPVIPERALVVGAGASRGIGVEMLVELARRYQPEIHILGSNDLQTHGLEALDESEESFRRRRLELLRQAASATGPSVAEVNAGMRRLGQAREVHRNLRSLERLCGRDNVHYHVCDMNDGAAVAAAVAAVTGPSGRRTDLLLNMAGVYRSAELANKRLVDFRAIRDVKVNAYVHLKKVYADRPPARWLNASSLAEACPVFFGATEPAFAVRYQPHITCAWAAGATT